MQILSRKIMQNIAAFTEIFLSFFMSVIIIILIFKLVMQGFTDVWTNNIGLSYYLEQAMTLAIGIEFVKVLCMHTPGAIIEVLLFAISRQMIVEHLSATETLIGVAAIAGLFAVRKYLFCSFDETDHMVCRGSQSIGHVNLISGVKIPEDKAKLLRDVVSEHLKDEGKNITIGACIYFKECALRVDSMKNDTITRVEVIKLH